MGAVDGRIYSVKVAGIDGCKGGWIAVEAEVGSSVLQSHMVRDIGAYLSGSQAPNIVAIDIPIGLTDSGPRKCDLLARAVIQPRGSSVFPSPIRSALAARTREEAHAISMHHQGKGVGAQSFGIYSKIREIDDLLAESPALRSRVYEIHPELCFAALKGEGERLKPMPHPKKSLQGATERLALVEDFFGQGSFAAIRKRHAASIVSDDDILDAMAAAWTAIRIAAGSAKSCPPDPEVDACGLRMAMWY